MSKREGRIWLTAFLLVLLFFGVLIVNNGLVTNKGLFKVYQDVQQIESDVRELKRVLVGAR